MNEQEPNQHKPEILLIARTLSPQGEKILGARWLPFIDFLRSMLLSKGKELKGSSDEMFLFSFSHPATAIDAIISLLERTKKEYGWPDKSGPVPLQLVLDIPPLTDNYQERGTWAPLEHEVIHISAQIRQRWAEFQVGAEMADHHLRQINDQFSALIFTEHGEESREKLLAYRSLPVTGQGQECFYCSMVDHFPADCPSRLLSGISSGIAELGYLPFATINEAYKRIFPLDDGLINELAQGVKGRALRNNPDLLVLVAYLDIWAVFQPRFLWNMAFSSMGQWDDIRQDSKLAITNRNLHMGLDCLRVGQYEQAAEMLRGESKKKDGALFAANIGLAFWALEQKRTSDMGRYLEEARGLAQGAAEIIYVNLLLSRYYEQQKDYWNAKEAVNNALKADYDCLDAHYRRVQLAVREGLSEREIKYLKNLVTGQADFFIKALLDPQLLPIQGLMDNMLRKQYQFLLADARENLQSAEAEFKTLEVWLDKKDRQLAENRSSLQQLAEQMRRQSYYDVLEVSERSKAIFAICHRLRRHKVEQLQEMLARQKKRLKAYQKFWRSFPHKSMFTEFQSGLSDALEKNKQALALIQRGKADEIENGRRLIKELTRETNRLDQLYGRLTLVQSLLHGSGIFARKLVLCEAVFLALVGLSFPLMGLAAGNDPNLAWAAQLAHNNVLLKKSLLISALFVAPLAALSWTLLALPKPKR